MEMWYNSNRNRGKTEQDGDFEEEEVWGYVKEKDSSSWVTNSKSKNNSMVQQSSLLSSPVNIPEWPKYINNKKKSSTRVVTSITNHGSSLEEEEEDDYGDGMVPPHEYIARREARNQIASYSMMEGVGRTLKGRDLSKVRNAILTKTGFLE